MKEKQEKTMEQIAMKVSWSSIFVNILLSLFKLGAGFLAASGAMISDGVHSASDVFSTVIVMIGFKMAGKDSDEKHPYGHERMECVAAVILAVVLGITGIGIGLDGVRKIVGGHEQLHVPGALALAAAILSILVKEGMYWYTRAAAKKISSDALMADAWHHRSDAFSSIGSCIGIIGARMGYPVLDPAASVIISLMIIKAAYDIFSDAIRKMLDESCDDETVEMIRKELLSIPGVLGVDECKTRMFGSKIYVDVEISADGAQTLAEAHNIAECAHDKIEKKFQRVKHCMIHVNPNKIIP